MKRFFANLKIKNLILCFALSLGFTVWLYWPLYQRIDLENSISKQEIERISLPINEEISRILEDRGVYFPFSTHQLCLLNRNRVYLVHADSPLFRTQDVSRAENIQETQAGAMAIWLYYSNTRKPDDLYKKVRQNLLPCLALNNEHLKNFASSTIEYRHIGLREVAEIDFENQGKILMTRDVAKSEIDTNHSWVALIAIPFNFILTFVTALISLVLLFGALSWLRKNPTEKLRMIE